MWNILIPKSRWGNINKKQQNGETMQISNYTLKKNVSAYKNYIVMRKSQNP